MKRVVLSVAGTLLLFMAIPKVTSGISPPIPTLQGSQQNVKIFSGTVIKNGDTYVLSDAANKLSFTLDDTEKASHYEGKKVKVTGKVDVASNTIHVETIQEIA